MKEYRRSTEEQRHGKNQLTVKEKKMEPRIKRIRQILRKEKSKLKVLGQGFLETVYKDNPLNPSNPWLRFL